VFIISGCRTPKTHTENTEQDVDTTSVAEFFLEPPVGVPAYPDTIHYELPDGYILKLFLRGDEYFHLAKTVDNFRILMNPEGFYEYAIYDDQGLPQPSGIIARNAEDRTDDEWRVLNELRSND